LLLRPDQAAAGTASLSSLPTSQVTNKGTPKRRTANPTMMDADINTSVADMADLLVKL
jgi:hypothetical protein